MSKRSHLCICEVLQVGFHMRQNPRNRVFTDKLLFNLGSFVLVLRLDLLLFKNWRRSLLLLLLLFMTGSQLLPQAGQWTMEQIRVFIFSLDKLTFCHLLFSPASSSCPNPFTTASTSSWCFPVSKETFKPVWSLKTCFASPDFRLFSGSSIPRDGLTNLPYLALLSWNGQLINLDDEEYLPPIENVWQWLPAAAGKAGRVFRSGFQQRPERPGHRFNYLQLFKSSWV